MTRSWREAWPLVFIGLALIIINVTMLASAPWPIRVFSCAAIFGSGWCAGGIHTLWREGL